MQDGPFSKDKWRLLNVSGGGCLKRDFTKVGLHYNSDHINKTLTLPLEDFMKFEEIVSLNYHLFPHFVIDGTMEDTIAANGPELLLYYSFVDKLWNQWQNKGEEYKNVYFPSIPFKV